MKFRALMIAALGCSLSFLTGCMTVAPGNVGLIFSKSGGASGVQDIATRSGRIVYNPMTTEIIEYPTYVQTVKWTKSLTEGNASDESITFTTSDSATVNVDVASSIQLDRAKAPAFYVKFRADDIQTFVDGFYRNIVRNKLNDIGGKYTVEQIMGNNGPMIAEVEQAVAHDPTLQQYGILVANLGFIGAPRPPSVVTDSINKKLAQQQMTIQTQNEILQTEAQAKKNEAQADGEAQSNLIRAKADAEANRLRQVSLTPLLIEQEKIAKWNGQLPNYQGAGGNFIFNK
jgi:regulator of protease activity HflC (stomatin/prohibitin superfamily)